MKGFSACQCSYSFNDVSFTHYYHEYHITGESIFYRYFETENETRVKMAPAGSYRESDWHRFNTSCSSLNQFVQYIKSGRINKLWLLL